MLIKAMNLIGLPVYAMENGLKIEDVDDIIYDPQENKVEALLVDKGGWFSDAKVLLIEDIKGIGKDAVIVDSEDVFKKASEVKENIFLITKNDTELTGSKILTEDGKELGTINDIYFDSRSGKVEEFEISQGNFKNFQSGKKRIKVTDILTVGSDATIVKGFTEEEFEEQSKEQGVKGAFYKSKSKVEEDIESIKERAPGFIDQIAENIRSAGKKAREEIYKLSDQMKNNLEEVKKHPGTRKTIEDIKTGAERAEEFTQSKFRELRKENLEGRKRDAVGQHLTKTILTPGDKILAKEGDIVTHKLLNEAQQYGVLDQVLKNVKKKERTLHGKEA